MKKIYVFDASILGSIKNQLMFKTGYLTIPSFNFNKTKTTGDSSRVYLSLNNSDFMSVPLQIVMRKCLKCSTPRP